MTDAGRTVGRYSLFLACVVGGLLLSEPEVLAKTKRGGKAAPSGPNRAVTLGDLTCEGSLINDSVTAKKGSAIKWQFFTGGPVRYDPVMEDGNVYVGSDDGYLYCLNADTGKEVWKFCAGPSNKRLIGNERMISVWHISSGPVIQAGRIYFTAGTWAMMGVFVYCLDARTGAVVWVNDHNDSEWRRETYRINAGGNDGERSIRYGSYSVSPRGTCEIRDNRLLVPCGSARTPCFDLKTGELLDVVDTHPARETMRSTVIEVTDPVSGRSAPLMDARVARNQVANWEYKSDRIPSARLPSDPAAAGILRHTRVLNGYALVLGIGNGKRIDGLLADSDLRLVVIDPDPAKVDALRRRLDAAGYYGLRVTALADNPLDAGLPPYFASLVVVGDPAALGAAPDFSLNILRSLRPYGGTACLDGGLISAATLAAQATKAGLDKTEVETAGDFVFLRRIGALTGAGSWSHQDGNAGNVFSTRDELVKGPLGVLWFGGPGGDPDVVYPEDKGGRGIWPLFVGGRILLERPGKISAVDVYTGRLLWQWICPDKEPWFMPMDLIGKSNVPAGMFNIEKYAAVYGIPTLIGRMAASEDAVYVVSDRKLHVLDSATGKPLAGFAMAVEDKWGPPVVLGDQVILTSDTQLVALNRHTGKVNWTFKEFGGMLAAGNNRIFCRKGLDTDVMAILEAIRQKWRKPAEPKRDDVPLVALDARTGQRLWKAEITVMPRATLVYSEEQDLLFADRAYKGSTGEPVKREAKGIGQFTPVLRNRYMPFVAGTKAIIGTWGPLHDLVSGFPLTYPDPITGEPSVDFVNRGSHYSYGCGPQVLGETIVASRITAATYYDLTLHSGVCSLNNFRATCTAPIVPADGVFCALNHNTCLCPNPIYSSVTFVHMPEADMWTYFPHRDPTPSLSLNRDPVAIWTNYPAGDPMRVEKPVRRVGINFGAPGDRMTETGTLWLDYPIVGGPSPALQVTTEPVRPTWFRHHQTAVKEGNGIPWVCCSGSKDLKSVVVNVNGGGPYRVREYYSESIAGNDLKLRSSVVEHANVKASPDGKLRWRFGGKGYVCGLELIAERE